MGTRYDIGSWRVDFDAGWIMRRSILGSRRRFPDRRLLDVLQVLVEAAGGLVTGEQLRERAWSGRVVTPESVTTAIYELRRELQDNASSPAYIKTEARQGYRLIARIRPVPRQRWPRPAVAFGVLLVAVAGALLVSQPSRDDGSMLYVDRLNDKTANAALRPLSTAIDATLLSALVRRNPGRVVAVGQGEPTGLRLETELVACDRGPALVVQLVDASARRYLWSETYSLRSSGTDPTLVERVATDVTAALPQI